MEGQILVTTQELMNTSSEFQAEKGKTEEYPDKLLSKKIRYKQLSQDGRHDMRDIGAFKAPMFRKWLKRP